METGRTVGYVMSGCDTRTDKRTANVRRFSDTDGLPMYVDSAIRTAGLESMYCGGDELWDREYEGNGGC